MRWHLFSPILLPRLALFLSWAAIGSFSGVAPEGKVLSAMASAGGNLTDVDPQMETGLAAAAAVNQSHSTSNTTPLPVFVFQRKQSLSVDVPDYYYRLRADDGSVFGTYGGDGPTVHEGSGGAIGEGSGDDWFYHSMIGGLSESVDGGGSGDDEGSGSSVPLTDGLGAEGGPVVAYPPPMDVGPETGAVPWWAATYFNNPIVYDYQRQYGRGPNAPPFRSSAVAASSSYQLNYKPRTKFPVVLPPEQPLYSDGRAFSGDPISTRRGPMSPERERVKMVPIVYSSSAAAPGQSYARYYTKPVSYYQPMSIYMPPSLPPPQPLPLLPSPSPQLPLSCCWMRVN